MQKKPEEISAAEQRLYDTFDTIFNEVIAVINRRKHELVDLSGKSNGGIGVAIMAQVIGALCASVPPSVSVDDIMELVAENMAEGMQRQRAMSVMAQIAEKEGKGRPPTECGHDVLIYGGAPITSV
jgi:hypothetical protein